MLFVVTLGGHWSPLQSNLILLLPDNQAQAQKNMKLPVRDDVKVQPMKSASLKYHWKMHLVTLFETLFPIHQWQGHHTSILYCESALVIHTPTIHVVNHNSPYVDMKPPAFSTWYFFWTSEAAPSATEGIRITLRIQFSWTRCNSSCFSFFAPAQALAKSLIFSNLLKACWGTSYSWLSSTHRAKLMLLIQFLH